MQQLQMFENGDSSRPEDEEIVDTEKCPNCDEEKEMGARCTHCEYGVEE